MSYETVYTIINLSVMPAWLLLALAPGAAVTRLVVHSGVYPLALGVFYIVTLSMTLFFGMGADGGGFGSAAGVSQLFSHPLGILVASLVLALTYVGGESAQTVIGLPSAATGVFQALMLFFLLGVDILVRYRLVRLEPAKKTETAEVSAPKTGVARA